jgi:hypothetical protein
MERLEIIRALIRECWSGPPGTHRPDGGRPTLVAISLLSK